MTAGWIACGSHLFLWGFVGFVLIVFLHFDKKEWGKWRKNGHYFIK